jgi:hypothetical protein
MKKFIRASTTWLTLITFLFTFFAPYGALAELAAPSATASNAPAATEDVYCNSICPSLAGSNGQLLGLSGSGTWSSTDDQWCANHGAQTSPSVLPISAPLGSTVPTGSCPGVTYYPGDTSCAQVTSQLQHCQYQNSQVESYCSAYESAKMAGAGEDMVFLLDVAAAGTCGAVCTMEMTSIGAGTGVQQICDGAAAGAGAAELLVTLTQQSSTMGKIASAALGAAGIGEGALAYFKVGGKCTSNGKGGAPMLDSNGGADPLHLNAPALPQSLGPAPSLPTMKNEYHLPSVDEFLATLFVSNAEAASGGPGCAKAACITAITMAALAGVRYYNMGYGKRTKASACNSIWNLQSSSAAIDGGVAAAGYSSSGGTLGATSSGSSTSGTTSGTAGTAAATSCVAAGGTVGSCSNGQISAATDGGILGTSGLGQVAAPLATQMAQAGLPASGDSGSPSGSMGGAMGGAGDFGNVLTKVADTAAQNGKELGQVASMGTGGGGGGGGGSASDAGGGFGSLFQPSGPSTSTAPVKVFKGEGSDSDDIYHSHTDKNIFQIISGRIEKSGSRVNF